MNSWHVASGYRFAGIASGLRSEPNRRDLAVFVSETPAVAAGVFTQNQVCAAPVQLSRSRLPQAAVRAIVVCSGNANACTGEQGYRDAQRMAELVALELECAPEQVLVASTGIIGRKLPMSVMEAGIPKAVQSVEPGAKALANAAHAILTTDTRIKVSTLELTLGVGLVRITGVAKGAAMIGPNMATMLGFLLTDAPIAPPLAHDILKRAANQTFNCISVEGHTSTNDTVFLLANGTGAHLVGDDLQHFDQGVTQVCQDLAKQIASDAEGAEHLITIDVEGCRSDSEAQIIAKSVANSALVKTAIFGADPNWGRIVSAAGYAGVDFPESQLSMWLGDLELYRHGQPLPFDAATASAYLKTNRDVRIRLVLSQGSGRCRFFTSDLTYEYIKLNAEYTT